MSLSQMLEGAPHRGRRSEAEAARERDMAAREGSGVPRIATGMYLA